MKNYTDQSDSRRDGGQSREQSSESKPESARERRPSGERRDDRPYRSRPSSDRRERPAGERRERPAGDRRDDRPFRSRPSADRPDRDRGERRERPASDRRERPAGDRRDDRPFRSRPSADRVTASEYTPKPRRRKALEEEGIRLNKFIANSGVCSRREADEYITAGLISVNGQIITELGTKIQSSDDVRFNGERLKGEEKVYILMNKPKDFVTTVTDPNAEKTVMDLIAGKCSQRVFPVGRLDKATTGVLLLTNDGEIAEKLTHPSNNQKKIYHVFLDKNFSAADFDIILKGITLEDGEVHADALSYVDGEKDEIGLEIHSGRNRIVR